MRTSLEANTAMPLPGSSFGYSAASRAPRMLMAACACATRDAVAEARLHEQGGLLRTPFQACVAALRRSGSDEIGSQKSVTRPMLMVPRCPTGPTPTIVTGTPSITNRAADHGRIRVGTFSSRPRARRTATTAPRRARPPLASNQRPSDGRSPSTDR